jgi:hypothetical protein
MSAYFLSPIRRTAAICDTLFGVDANGKPQPEMVDKYTASPNAKLCTIF